MRGSEVAFGFTGRPAFLSQAVLENGLDFTGRMFRRDNLERLLECL